MEIFLLLTIKAAKHVSKIIPLTSGEILQQSGGFLLVSKIILQRCKTFMQQSKIVPQTSKDLLQVSKMFLQQSKTFPQRCKIFPQQSKINLQVSKIVLQGSKSMASLCLIGQSAGESVFLADNLPPPAETGGRSVFSIEFIESQ